jgi:hypothetical protein
VCLEKSHDDDRTSVIECLEGFTYGPFKTKAVNVRGCGHIRPDCRSADISTARASSLGSFQRHFYSLLLDESRHEEWDS